jgi:hypothetical protein
MSVISAPYNSTSTVKQEMLDGALAGLCKQLSARQRPEMFKDLLGRITLVDGTVLDTLPTRPYG